MIAHKDIHDASRQADVLMQQILEPIRMFDGELSDLVIAKAIIRAAREIDKHIPYANVRKALVKALSYEELD